MALATECVLVAALAVYLGVRFDSIALALLPIPVIPFSITLYMQRDIWKSKPREFATYLLASAFVYALMVYLAFVLVMNGENIP